MPWPEPGQGRRHALAGAGPGEKTCLGRSQARPGHSLPGVGCGSPASQATRRPHPRGSLTDIYQPGSRLVCINRTMKRSTSINLV